ncbi:MAG TPA: CapA family protein [Actinoplanes sp.]
MSSPEPRSGTGFLGKAARSLLGLVVLTGTVGVATHAMGLWQIGGPDDPPVKVRPAADAVAVRGRTVTVLAAGSILPSPEIWDQARRDGGGSAFDFGPILAGAAPAVSSADLALCHLSAPLAAAGGPHTGPPRYNVPAELAKAIADTGFDGCATAAEHAFDQGTSGIARTLDALDEAKLGHSGTHRSEEQADRTRLYTVDGVKVAHLSYTLALNGQKVPAGREWAVARPTAEGISSDAEDARLAGAGIVVVSLDWGSEREHEPDVDQQNLARAIAKIRNVDVVFGHGSHVVQPVEKIDGKWIFYGLGDFSTRHSEPVTDNREGTMMRVTFSPADGADRWKVAAIEALPTFIDLNPAIRIVDLEQALADPGVFVGRRKIYEATVDRIESHLLNRGGGGSVLRIRGVGK